MSSSPPLNPPSYDVALQLCNVMMGHEVRLDSRNGPNEGRGARRCSGPVCVYCSVRDQKPTDSFIPLGEPTLGRLGGGGQLRGKRGEKAGGKGVCRHELGKGGRRVDVCGSELDGKAPVFACHEQSGQPADCNGWP